MIKLKNMAALKRKIRQDDIEELGIPTWELVSRAIKAGKTDEALEYLEYAHQESERNNASLVSFIEQLATHLSGIDEEEWAKVVRNRYEAPVKEWLAITPGVEESLRRCTEAQRGHHAAYTVKEEPDRYVVTYDPCGSGGNLRRTRAVGTTKKAHPWSWGKAGVPNYCCHCCIHWEMLPIEQRGYPIRVTIMPEKPGDPCVQYFYKKPELIPEKYFTRLGKKKTIK